MKKQYHEPHFLNKVSSAFVLALAKLLAANEMQLCVRHSSCIMAGTSLIRLVYCFLVARSIWTGNSKAPENISNVQVVI